MKIKVAKYISQFLVGKGVTDLFTITGGGAMHLNDAFGHEEGLHCTYNHHEQACAMAAEGYARMTGRIAGVCVTSGPGGTNAITGVLGGWQDSIPMFIISGQVKRETTTWSTDVPLRQLGDQEFQIVDSVKNMTKYAVMITEPNEIRYHLEKAWFLANNGRKGPVWLDIPLDVQGAMIETEELKDLPISEQQEMDRQENPVYDKALTKVILQKIRDAKRPVIFAGTGIRLAGAYQEFIDCITALCIPVVTAWNAHDLLEDDHPFYGGRPGTVGTRGGNFVVQNCDLLLVLGSRLNIRLISYNYSSFAKDAYKIVVDIDENELHKPTIKPDMAVHANVKDVMRSLADAVFHDPETMEISWNQKVGDHGKWLECVHNVNQKYPVVLPEYYEKEKPLNPYVFLDKFTDALQKGDTVITGNGSACVMTFQAARIKREQRLFTNSGCAAMGYGFPAALGACVAENQKAREESGKPDATGARIVCIDGDGSFQMNMQELQTVVYNHLNMKIVILNNNGYHSIRQTQTNLFDPPMVGVCQGNGLSFPDMEKIACAYGIPYIRVDQLSTADEMIRKGLDTDGPVIMEAVVDPEQNFAPKLSSRALPDGTMVSPELDDMFPFLPKEEYEDMKHNLRERIVLSTI
ncbi:MAG: thiamine pyrophosphate-binding protein [Lachnospiraceae bacterium]|nr:thiamine pyrophosphate-binding protein [Lachnospiraceae bacterium]